MKFKKSLLLLIPLTLTFAVSSSKNIGYLLDSYKNKNIIAELVNSHDTSFIEAEDLTPLDLAKTTISSRKLIVDELKQENKDVVGWIYIHNTKIDYPLLQSDDNEVYLYNDYTGSKTRYGSIFIDYRNNIDSLGTIDGENLVIYGHNMKDGQMFGSLDSFSNLDFFNSNVPIGLILNDKEYYFEAFSSYITSMEDNYIQTNFTTADEYIEFINSVNEKAYFHYDQDISDSKFILTLSTCSTDDTRLAVHCRLIE